MRQQHKPKTATRISIRRNRRIFSKGFLDRSGPKVGLVIHLFFLWVMSADKAPRQPRASRRGGGGRPVGIYRPPRGRAENKKAEAGGEGGSERPAGSVQVLARGSSGAPAKPAQAAPPGPAQPQPAAAAAAAPAQAAAGQGGGQRERSRRGGKTRRDKSERGEQQQAEQAAEPAAQGQERAERPPRASRRDRRGRGGQGQGEQAEDTAEKKQEAAEEQDGAQPAAAKPQHRGGGGQRGGRSRGSRGRRGQQQQQQQQQQEQAQQAPEALQQPAAQIQAAQAPQQQQDNRHEKKEQPAAAAQHLSRKQKEEERRKKKAAERSERRKQEEQRKQEQLRKQEKERKKQEEERKRQEEIKRKEEEERQKAEEERRAREEEERKRREDEERKRKEEEERKTKEEEERKRKEEEAAARLADAKKLVASDKKRRAELVAARQANQDGAGSAAGKKDSNVKKTSSWLKKLRDLSQQEPDEMLSGARKLNLARYVSEAVDALAETKLTTSKDVKAAVQVAAAMHASYPTFCPDLVKALLQSFAPLRPKKDKGAAGQQSKDKQPESAASPLLKAAGKGAEDVLLDKPELATRWRSVLRFLTDLCLHGLVPNHKPILNVLAQLVCRDSGRDDSHTSLSLLVAYLKQRGDEFLGLVGRPTRQAYQLCNEQLVATLLLPADDLAKMKEMLDEYLNSVVQRLHDRYHALRRQQRSNAKALLFKGEVSEQRKATEAGMKVSFEKLQELVVQLAQVLDKDLPELPPEPEEAENDMLTIIQLQSKEASAIDQSLYDDEDTRTFYENVPQLASSLPRILLADDKDKGEKNKQGEEEKEKEEKEKNEKEEGKEETDVEQDAEEAAAAAEQSEAELEAMLGENAAGSEQAAGGSGGEAAGDTPAVKAHPLDSFFARMETAFSRALIDKLSEEFCYHNTKANRQRLIRVLFTVKRSQLELLPYYARMATTLSNAIEGKPNVGHELVRLVRADFYRLLKKKDSMLLQARLWNIRYLSELTKFRLAPHAYLFQCWDACLQQFKHHNIDVVCTLLECTGRWLYRNRETHLRTESFLQRTMKLKDVLGHVSPTQKSMLESAFYAVKPPETTAFKQQKERSLLHRYIRHQLFRQLKPRTVEEVLERMRRLPWDAECSLLVLKALTQVMNVSFSNVACLASVASGLNRYHPIGVPLVDAVLEEIRVGLDMNLKSQQQRRLVTIRYLGELYAYRLVDSQVIFDTLYLLITYGHTFSEEDGTITSSVDPPGDTFRILLVVALLQTCGMYFAAGGLAKRLDRFLVYFQRYILMKEVLPVSTEFDLQEVLSMLRPDLKRIATIEDCMAKINKLEGRYLARRGADRLRKLQVVKANSKDGGGDGGAVEEEEVEEEDDEEEEDEEEDNKEGDGMVARRGGREAEDAAGEQAAAAATAAKEGDEEDEDDDDEQFRGFGRRGAAKEDDEFGDMLAKMMAEDAESRTLFNRNAALKLAPAHSLARDSSQDGGGGSTAISARPKTQVAEDADGEQGLLFRVLSRQITSSNKQTTTFKKLLVPLDTSLAQQTAKQEEQRLKEKEVMKRLVQAGLEREAREDMEAAIRFGSSADSGGSLADSELDRELEKRRQRSQRSQARRMKHQREKDETWQTLDAFNFAPSFEGEGAVGVHTCGASAKWCVEERCAESGGPSSGGQKKRSVQGAQPVRRSFWHVRPFWRVASRPGPLHTLRLLSLRLRVICAKARSRMCCALSSPFLTSISCARSAQDTWRRIQHRASVTLHLLNGVLGSVETLQPSSVTHPLTLNTMCITFVFSDRCIQGVVSDYRSIYHSVDLKIDYIWIMPCCCFPALGNSTSTIKSTCSVTAPATSDRDSSAEGRGYPTTYIKHQQCRKVEIIKSVHERMTIHN
eukprot:g59162.t1